MPPTRRSWQPKLQSVSPGTLRTNGELDACSPGDPRFPLLAGDCEGFRVLSPHGRLGEVERVSFSPDGQPQALLVRIGLFRRNLVEIPVETIDWIVPAGRRILISHTPTVAANTG